MKKNLLKKLFVVAVVTTMTGAMLAGCGSKDTNTTEGSASATEQTIDENEVATADTPEGEETADANEEAKYFKKGVYVNYAKEAENPDKNYFYVFQGFGAGYTDDGAAGVGMPFSYEEGDGVVKFYFGGDGELEDVLTVSSVEDGVVTGAFEDGLELVFELVDGADADSFSAENFVNGPEDSVYHDANGWSVKYDANNFTVNNQDGQVFFVYQGESAGTNIITVTYTVENNAEDAIKALGESWGNDGVDYTEGIFPGTEDVKGYWASLAPSSEGSGLYETAVARDYMDGALIFELTGHNGIDEEQNMEVSDQMASVIDSLTFDQQ